jgi:hypothetical protein
MLAPAKNRTDMKKFLTSLCAIALISALSAGFVACNEPKNPDDEPTEVGITPVTTSEISEEITAFFEKLNSDVFWNRLGQNKQVCLTVNEAKELRAMVPSEIELPHIDFEKHTLVFGIYFLPEGGYCIKDQGVDVYLKEMKLNLVLEQETGNVFPAVLWPGYVNIFPKLPNKPITFNCIYLP